MLIYPGQLGRRYGFVMDVNVSNIITPGDSGGDLVSGGSMKSKSGVSTMLGHGELTSLRLAIRSE